MTDLRALVERPAFFDALKKALHTHDPLCEGRCDTCDLYHTLAAEFRVLLDALAGAEKALVEELDLRDIPHKPGASLFELTFYLGQYLSNREQRLSRVLELGRRVVEAQAHYRLTHDLKGDGHLETGQAWDAMRKSADAFKAELGVTPQPSAERVVADPDRDCICRNRGREGHKSPCPCVTPSAGERCPTRLVTGAKCERARGHSGFHTYEGCGCDDCSGTRSRVPTPTEGERYKIYDDAGSDGFREGARWWIYRGAAGPYGVSFAEEAEARRVCKALNGMDDYLATGRVPTPSYTNDFGMRASANGRDIAMEMTPPNTMFTPSAGEDRIPMTACSDCGASAIHGIDLVHRKGCGVSAGETKPLTRCAAERDGECRHPQCPQLRDGEPVKSGRHCPLDVAVGARPEDEQERQP